MTAAEAAEEDTKGISEVSESYDEKSGYGIPVSGFCV
jgi:hypothetical protein